MHHSCVDYSQKGDITVSTIPTSVTEDQFNDHIRPYLNTAKRGYECSIPLLSIWQKTPVVFQGDAQTIGDPVDVSVIGGDLRDVQNGPVIETGSTQGLDIGRSHRVRGLGEFGGVVEHDPVGLVQVCLGVIVFELRDQGFVLRQLTKVASMMHQSVSAMVDGRNDDRDHLALGAFER